MISVSFCFHRLAKHATVSKLDHVSILPFYGYVICAIVNQTETKVNWLLACIPRVWSQLPSRFLFPRSGGPLYFVWIPVRCGQIEFVALRHSCVWLQVFSFLIAYYRAYICKNLVHKSGYLCHPQKKKLESSNFQQFNQLRCCWLLAISHRFCSSNTDTLPYRAHGSRKSTRLVKLLSSVQSILKLRSTLLNRVLFRAMR